MSKEIVFSAVKSFGDNKKLDTDDKGYYRVTLGFFNAYNAHGAFYLADGAEDIILNKSHSLARRLKAGYLKGEVSHPVYQPGMTKAAFYARNLRIDQTRVSHHIRDVILVETGEKVYNPKTGVEVNVIRVDGWIKPSGPYGDALKKDLDNPDVNVAFSIRSFTDDVEIGGVVVKKLLQIVTWDWVIEPGMPNANKFNKLSTEELAEMTSFKFDIDEIADSSKNITECYNCSFESKDEVEITNELIDAAIKDSVYTRVLNEW